MTAIVIVTLSRRERRFRPRIHNPRPTLALLAVLLLTTITGSSTRKSRIWCDAFQPSRTPSRTAATSKSSLSVTSSQLSSSLPDNNGNDNNELLFQLTQKALSNVTDSVSEIYQQDVTAEQELEEELDTRKRALEQRRRQAGTATTSASSAPTTTVYTVQLNHGNNELRGLAMAQVQMQSGALALAEQQLNLDTLEMEPLTNSDILKDSHTATSSSNNNNKQFVVVTKVDPESVAYQKYGVRVGHALVAVSATLGSNVWPQSTIQGLESALRSRRRLLTDVQLELVKKKAKILITDTTTTKDDDDNNSSAATATSSTTATTTTNYSQDNQYELTLPRPLGVDISDDNDNGYVVVTGYQKGVISKLAQSAIQIGDRIVAVDSSLGFGKLWPVSTVAGVQSACTSRLPGQAVTLRLERPWENMAKEPIVYDTNNNSNDATTNDNANDQSANNSAAAVTVQPARSMVSDVTLEERQQRQQRMTAPDAQTLLSRCRAVLRRYALKKRNEGDYSLAATSIMTTGGGGGGTPVDSAAATASAALATAFKGKHAVPGIVADKVVDAIQSAGAKFDAVTLSMVLQAYQSVGQYAKVIATFDLAVAGHVVSTSTSSTTSSSSDAAATSTEMAVATVVMDAHTVTALLQAHTGLGNLDAVQRIWKDVTKSSSQSDASALPWNSVTPDATMYNVVLHAYERLGNLEMVQALADRMKDPSTTSTAADTRVEKTVTTYNTLIRAYANAGHDADAWGIFNHMAHLPSSTGIAPDIFTYTSMIDVCDSADVEELWYDMLERGVHPDIQAYNARIRVLCSKRQWTQATRLVTEMERTHGIAPNSRTYSELMNAMLPTKPYACLALFEAACAADRTAALTDHVHLYTTAVAAAAKLGNHERALELVARMKSHGVKPNLKTLTAVIGACLASKEYSLAADVYRRMLEASADENNPLVLDGYAKMLGVTTLCGNNECAAALEQVLDTSQGRVLGPQRMKCYQSILEAALSSEDYSTAKRAVQDLMERHFIPGKALVQDMLRAMELHHRKQRGLVTPKVALDRNAAALKWDFLLYFMDALEGRNLEVPASLYATLLTLGSQLGGRYRKIAKLVHAQRVAATENNRSEKDKSNKLSWQDLDDGNVETVTIKDLPPVPVRISKREFQQVLRAERSIPLQR